MRHPLRPAALFVLAVVAYALLGVAVADATGASVADPRISGQVTDENGTPVGDAYVLLEPTSGATLVEATDGDQAVAESLLKLAQSDPDGVTVVRTGEDGTYSATIGSDQVRVVAVTADARRVSTRHAVEVPGDNATVDLEVDRNRVLHVDADTAGPVAPGNETAVAVRIPNPDDEAVRSLSLAIGGLPEGWTLAGVDTNGSYDVDAQLVNWERVPPGEAATATLHVRVAAGAERGHHSVPLTADSDSHFVEDFDDGRVVVRPANATPTPTAVGGEATSATTTTPRVTGALTSTPTETSPTGPPPTSTTSPGFGLVVALAGLVALVAGLRATESR